MTPADQLAQELGSRAYALAVVLNGDTIRADQKARLKATFLVAQLDQEDEERLAAQVAIDVMCALWPDGTEPPSEWWSTPLGRLMARHSQRDDAEAVTQSIAAAMLGVSKGTISQWVHRGTLDRHPDGGVLRSSVMARLGRQIGE